MKTKLMLVAVLLLLLPSLAGAQTSSPGVTRFPLMTGYDSIGGSFTYCVTTGQGGRVLSPGRPGVARVKVASGPDTTLESYTSGSSALDLLSVGDELEINAGQMNGDNPVAYASVVTVTSDDSVEINQSLTLSQTGGHGYRWRKRDCTGSGWFPVMGGGYTTIQIEADAAGDVSYTVDCRIAGSSSSGVAVDTGTVNNSTAAVRVQGPWDECRLGVKSAASNSVDGYVEIRN